MKKLIFVTLTALFLAPLCANAQGEQFAERPSVETTQSVSLNATPTDFGVHYTYEHPLARRATLIGRVGASVAGVGDTGDFIGTWNYWFVAPTIDIESRFYYGLDRRAAHGRSTAGNSGSFLALQVKNLMPFGYVSASEWTIDGATLVTPMWGLRRVWNENWLFEVTTGYTLALGWQGNVGSGLHVGLNFGYTF
jgi:hypothetical protein